MTSDESAKWPFFDFGTFYWLRIIAIPGRKPHANISANDRLFAYTSRFPILADFSLNELL
jgi:hypothetical protein